MKGVDYAGDNKFFVTEFVHEYAVIIQLLSTSIPGVSTEEKELYKKELLNLHTLMRNYIRLIKYALKESIQRKTYLESAHKFEEALTNLKAKQIVQVINTEISDNVHDQILSCMKKKSFE